MATRLKLGVLISGRGSNLQSLIDACTDHSFPGHIVTVISNKADAFGLERAQKAGIQAFFIDHHDDQGRQGFEEKLDTALRQAQVDLVCLAGFMRILTPWFIARWENRILNMHPSLLPDFKGLHTHQRVLEAGAKITGCTVHLVRPELDEGPILLQSAVPVLPDDTPETLADRVLVAEHQCYPLAIRLYVRDHWPKNLSPLTNTPDTMPAFPEDRLLNMRFIEALLFASSEPMSVADLSSHLENKEDIESLLKELAEHYASRGINLIHSNGRWAFRTAPDVAPRLQTIVEKSQKLSRVALETLAIIAYHQPVTRAEIESIRGVSTSKGTLDQLLELGWVAPGRRKETPGRPVTWQTTPAFLDHFGLSSIKDLPGVDDLKAAGLLDKRPVLDKITGTMDDLLEMSTPQDDDLSL